ATVTLVQSASAISGYNFVLGTLPSASPAYAGSIAKSGDGNSVLLTLTAGPIGTRPSVPWVGVDALSNVNTNWSDALNWLSPGVPAAAEPVFFNDTASVSASAISTPGGGISDLVPSYINNIVDVSLTNAALSYATTSGFHNTQIASGKTLTVNGNLTVSGSGGTVTILGTNAAAKINNPGSSSTLDIEASNGATLDMSGLDTFAATVNRVGVAYDIASTGTKVLGTLYLARTNTITTGV